MTLPTLYINGHRYHFTASRMVRAANGGAL